MSNTTSEFIEYSFNNVTLEAYVARPENTHKAKTVLICHAWAGRDQFVVDTANKFAGIGFVGVALDVYGKGVLGDTVDEKMALMQPLLESRAELQGRLQAGLEVIQSQDYVNADNISAIGYCFGGLCVLDMARLNLPLKLVISVHGLFNKPDNISNYTINTKVLALHGHLDPMVQPEAVTEFTQELDAAKADWQINVYGKALHAFTNPEAHDHHLGTVFNQDVANRAWRAITDFLQEA